MGCNGHNHAAGCKCGWGGDGHKGRSAGGWARTARPLRSYIYKDIYSEVDTENRKTTCPKCGSSVFFIRHNGGTVWLDHPLTYPWYKHSCFDNFSSKTTKEIKKRRLAPSSASTTPHSKIIVVEFCCYRETLNSTRVRFKSSHGEIFSLDVRHDATEIVGNICFMDEKIRAISLLDNSSKKFFYSKPPRKHLGNQTTPAKVSELNSDRNDSSRLIKNRTNPEENAVFLVKKSPQNEKMQETLSKNHVINKCPATEPDLGLKEAELIIKSAMKQMAAPGEWIRLADVGNWLAQHEPLFTVKKYGFKKLSRLAEATNSIELKKTQETNHGHTTQIHIRNPTSSLAIDKSFLISKLLLILSNLNCSQNSLGTDNRGK